MKLKTNIFVAIAVVLSVFTQSCSKMGILGGGEKSPTTGMPYNSKEYGGFQHNSGYHQETGPGLVYIQGGSFTMGQTQQDVLSEWNNVPRRVTLPSYYIDECEVRNVDYLEYLYWLKRVYVSYPSVHKKALPDTLVWRNELAYNEPYVLNYLRHPAYAEYPVVGVSWEQAVEYCEWRTDRVNEQILIEKGILNPDPNQKDENNFNTDAYLAGKYIGSVKENLDNLGPDGEDKRPVRWNDGILLPKYRLPTEAEWEYAALGLVGNTSEERITSRRIYPWNGHWVRNENLKDRGKMMANFARGRGDYMGTAGSLNDGGDITMPVKSFWPNDYGLYCMSGNVNEWVADVYRPMSSQDVAEFNPYRGNVFTTLVRDSDGNVVEKDSLGRLRRRLQTDEELIGRKNYHTADNRNYKDGDVMSSIVDDGQWNNPDHQKGGSGRMYVHAKGGAKGEYSSLVTDETRVYKGGSWKDRAYWLSPSTRRYLGQREATDDIGFRCAMSHVGKPRKDEVKK
ncbi:MAG: gliding motility lipoprotein GldJ [Marinifilaceae bacterium]|jgi:gliding motility-associated lipoprotein GldJ|nr:gliding motility lipoprotein GldJ [Marinifilaceae bacterium]